MAVVQSLGGLTAIEPVLIPYSVGASSGSMSLYSGTVEDYATLYEQQPAVRTVVDFLARNVAQLGLHTYRRISAALREDASDHPMAQVLRSPNPKTTRYRLIRDTISDKAIFDDAYWLKVAAGGSLMLVRLPAAKIVPLGGPFFADSYRYVGKRGSLTFSADQVVHFRGFNALDPRRGFSPLETLRRILAEEQAMGEYREGYWRNSARMETVITRPLQAPEWGEIERKRFRADWEAKYTGPNASGKTAVLEEGMDVKTVSSSARDSQYLESRKFTRAEVATAYHIPLQMIGISGETNYANVREFHRILYQDTLGPTLEETQQDVELQLLPEFEDQQGIYLEFDIEDKLEGSFAEEAAATSLATGGPWMLRAEARARRNLPPLTGDDLGDELIVPLNVTEGGQAAPNAPQPTGTVAAAARRFLQRQHRALSARLGADGVKLDGAFDLDRWNRELVEDMRAAQADGEEPDPLTAELVALGRQS